eukprot:1160658-Pelagomonas_calceolata.AAC.1
MRVGNSQTNNCVYRMKSHAGIAGHKCADAIAKYQANEANNDVTDTGIPSAGPGGDPLSIWSAKEEKEGHMHSLLNPLPNSPTFPILKVP